MSEVEEALSEQENASSSEGELESIQGTERGESALQNLLFQKKSDLPTFLLLKYCTKERTTKEEMVSTIFSNYLKSFSSIFNQTCEYMLLVFGIKGAESRPPGPFLVPVLASPMMGYWI